MFCSKFLHQDGKKILLDLHLDVNLYSRERTRVRKNKDKQMFICTNIHAWQAYYFNVLNNLVFLLKGRCW